jgi:cation diffusion facilitator CzcD-associated flavoprotein CzcO
MTERVATPKAAHVDVLIVGAGVSGIGMACHLTRKCPDKSYLVLERRRAVGGTWDLFRYPGIRSDSDMFTFGYNFRPWTATKVLADGPSIRTYLTETAREYAVEEHIRFGHRVVRADWSSAQARWRVEAVFEETGESVTVTAAFLVGCTGYYDYDSGYRPTFPGEERFTGPVVHPQHWPADLDYAGKRVVVIGSGATAVTLVPALAVETAHVTMLQRSPSYIISLPADDKISETLRKLLPERAVYTLARLRNVALQRGLYAVARRRPALVRKLVLAGVRRALGPDADLRHFTPRYDPWDQRLCVIPNGDLFQAIREGRASIVTDEIDSFTESGIALRSGEHLAADIIVAATGLQIQMLGGGQLSIDGEPYPLNRMLTYKSVMLEGVPNAAMIFGYTNASWTLKADIAAEFACRLIKHLDVHGYGSVVAHAPDDVRTGDSVLSSLAAGYVRRGNDVLPRQGTKAPWTVLNNYLTDAPMLRYRRIDDGILRFSSRPTPAAAGTVGTRAASGT